MASAYKCDRSEDLFEGDPVAYLQIVGGKTLSLCGTCVDEIINDKFPKVAEERAEEAAARESARIAIEKRIAEESKPVEVSQVTSEEVTLG